MNHKLFDERILNRNWTAVEIGLTRFAAIKMSHNESFTSSGSMLIGSDHPGLISSSIFVNFESFYTDREKWIRETEI